MLRLHRWTAPLAACALATMLACGGDPTGPTVGDVIVEPSSVVLEQLQSIRLDASVVDADGNLLTGIAVTFASTDEAIVTVSKLGEVTSAGPAGTASVRVSAGGFTKTVPVIVHGVATSLSVTPEPASMPQQGTLQLRAAVVDLAGDEIPGKPIRFRSLDPEILSVTESSGLVTSLGPHGQGRVEVWNDEPGSYLYRRVRVTVSQVARGMRVAPASLRLAPGGSARLHATQVDLLGAEMPGGGPYTFTSSDPSVVTVAGDGTVRSAGPIGEATVTVTDGESSQDVPVQVLEGAAPEGQVVGSVAVPYAFGVAFAPEGIAYATSLYSGVHRVDADALSAMQISTASSGLDLAITSDGERAYVASHGAARVVLISLQTGEALATSPQLSDAALTDMLTDDERTLWVGTGDGLVVMDAATLAVEHTLGVGPVIHLARHPTAPVLYATGKSGRVIEVDMSTRTVLRTILLEGATQGVAVSPDGRELYVADEGGRVRFVDVESGMQTGSLALSGGGYGIVASRNGLRLYVSLSLSGALAIVDPSTRTVLGTLDVGGTPRRLALSPDGTVLLVANEHGGVIVIR